MAAVLDKPSKENADMGSNGDFTITIQGGPLDSSVTCRGGIYEDVLWRAVTAEYSASEGGTGTLDYAARLFVRAILWGNGTYPYEVADIIASSIDAYIARERNDQVEDFRVIVDSLKAASRELVQIRNSRILSLSEPQDESSADC